jgi:hypothetical protein
MKKFVPFLLLGTLLLIMGCSKKSTKSEPQPTDPYILQASQTIGAEGGTLSIGDFSLEVPAGAFDSDAQVKLYASTQDRPYGDFAVSRTFQLEGLPPVYNQPLRVAVEYEDTLADESFLAVGRKGFDPANNGWGFWYYLLDAADSSGWLTCQLPSEIIGSEENGSGGYGGTGKDDPIEEIFLRLLGVTEFRTCASVQDRFRIIYPVVWEIYCDDLAYCLEDSYDFLEGMGFEFKDRSKLYPAPVIEYPIDVELRSFSRDDVPASGHLLRRCSGSTVEAAWFSIDLNEAYMGAADPSRLCVAAGRAVFELIPEMYIISPLWLDWSVSLWLGEKFCKNPPYVPAGFENHQMVPFGGIKNATGYEHAFRAAASAEENPGVTGMLDNYYSYSCGLSPIITYLTDEYGDEIIADIYEQISESHQQDDVAVLVNNVSQPVSHWWPNFFKKYLTGDIYGVNADVFLENNSGELKLSQKHDTTFTQKYSDLSAKLFLIHLDDTDLDQEASISFEVNSTETSTDDLSMLVFGLKSDGLHCLKQGQEKVTLGGVKALMQQDYSKLVAVVVDSRLQAPYTDEHEVDLKVHLGVSYSLWFHISFGADERRSYPDKPDEIIPTVYNITAAPDSKGNLTDSSFSVSWSNEQHEYHVESGTMDITFSSDTGMVRELHLSKTETWNSFTRQTELTATDVQRTYSPEYPHDLIYTIEGEQTCSYFDVTKHQRDYDNGEVWSYEPGSCECILSTCSVTIWLHIEGR